MGRRWGDIGVGLFGELSERGLDLSEGASLRDPEHIVCALADLKTELAAAAAAAAPSTIVQLSARADFSTEEEWQLFSHLSLHRKLESKDRSTL